METNCDKIMFQHEISKWIIFQYCIQIGTDGTIIPSSYGSYSRGTRLGHLGCASKLYNGLQIVQIPECIAAYGIKGHKKT